MSAKAGRLALVGRPNAGKSTLMNRLLQEKVAAVSDKPQTTRHRLVGVLTEDRGQVVFLDTPGMHRPLHRLNQQMVHAAREALTEGDVVCLLVDASQSFGKGDLYMLELLEKVRRPKILALNKVDRVSKPRLLPMLERYAETGQFRDMVPVSALTGDGCDELLSIFFDALPEGEPIYPADTLTLHSERFLAAETIREKVLERAHDELPYTTAVLIEQWEEKPEKDLVVIHAQILVERPGHKGILVGAQGSMIKEIGIAARRDLEELLGRRVHLDLFVRLQPGWREDRRLLAELDRHLIAGY